jgi:acyl carrier protein
MDETGSRLSKCFLAIFPALQPAEIRQASAESVPDWDSLAHVTLIAVISEEFGVELDLEDFQHRTSFESIHSYVSTLNHS